MNFDRRNNVGFNAAHNVALDPIVLLFHNPVPMVKPSCEMAGRKSRRIPGKIQFDRFEWKAALSDERLQYGSEFRVAPLMLPAAVQSRILPIHCITLNQLVVLWYSFPCMPNPIPAYSV
jgi:hypothetical protein